ncbi:type VI secretion system-associated lipoprotein [Erwinia sp. OLTSP20]|uniref:type VI secretion system lipoprotein TssJ n=1 Tax=unclassified Erwinia TaxID=2622719 RepID=UPI000C1A50A2|nr:MULTISPECIES: type VI secretion system lipoprotein TssJ [unclassified Erwinia]PIJ49615.1 type VI secretion system-associated lipoprotein [Erwinia sp. OAMSP11]PIJ71612.1 type VI secretion system-associated lipoprotein [Erwinia sp. OLSSP12]PIJ82682.1 type VI secretion system-associated lipoprotein [Erwinia sp. OLCASP19]PIJ83149.1 type VI secretion system-associated lipoprotein [Erwinia sp. OLMTSP26]PIJ85315.1 type VI secretion system-associated lipoprotein [Erwinia sp. OLMDSP33]
MITKNKKYGVFFNYHFAINLLIITLSLLIASCSASDNEKKQDAAKEVLIKFQADNNINPDNDNYPAPVRVAIYKLKNISDFQNAFYADFDDVNSGNSQAVAMMKTESFIITPGEDIEIKLPVDDGTSAMGFVTEYRDITRSNWKTVYKIPERPKDAWYRIFWPSNKKWRPVVKVHMEYLTTSIEK